MDVDISRLLSVEPSGPTLLNWADVASGSPRVVLASITPVTAIVGSQDCDATRAEDITLFEIRRFHDVEGRDRARENKPKKWVPLVTQHARVNQKWFYLPADVESGISERMAVDFRIPLKVLRENLEAMTHEQRIARLNDVAYSHFRERISDFFRRYAYDEWYPLTPEEFAFYDAQSGPVEAFPWQREPEDL